MLAPETIVAFTTTSLVLALIPGPDNIFVLMQAAMRGARVGFAVTLGLCTGLILHTAAVAFGIAVLFQRSELAFTGLKIAGALYLLYLAYAAFRAGPARLGVDAGAARPYWRMYARGVLMNITNPKVAIFFLAFLPQFVSPGAGPVAAQVASLGALFIAATLVAFVVISLLAGAIADRIMASERAQVMMNRFAGVVFVGLAAKLATAQR